MEANILDFIRPLRKPHYLKFEVANTCYEVDESEAEPFSSVSVFIRDNFETFCQAPKIRSRFRRGLFNNVVQ